MSLQKSKIVGQHLRRERLRLNLSQEELARAINTTAVSISRWERGIVLPQPNYRERLCRIFNVEAASLFETDDEEQQDEKPAPANYWNLPYHQNPLFTGREEILMRLHDAMDTSTELGRALAICGLGGIGKTQTAIEFAYQFRSEYQAVLWVRGETYDVLIADLIEIATLLNLPQKNDKNQQDIIRAVHDWLAEHRHWLLIVDNIEDMSLLKSIVPPGHCGHILLTTHAQSLSPFAECLSLEKMTEDEGALLLLRRARYIPRDAHLEDAAPCDQELARTISLLTGGLPLALDQAGAYIDETQCSLQDYLQLFQSHSFQFLRERGMSDDHPLSFARTFALAFSQIQQKNPAAARLLTFCAFLAPDAIPEALLSLSAAFLDPVLATLLSQPIALNAAFKDLLAYSLLHRNGQTKLLSVHRLVQAVLKEGMPEEQQREWIMRTVKAINHIFPFSPTQQMAVDQWPWCEQLLPHALEVLKLSERWNIATVEVASLLVKTGSYLSERARYEEAEPLFLRARTIEEQAPQPEPSDMAILFEALALLYKRQGKYQEAEPLFLRAKSLWEQMLGKDCLEVTGPLVGLADLYRYQGKYTEAEALFLQAISILSNDLAPGDLQLAYPLYTLGHLYAQQGRFERAEPLYRQSLSIWKHAMGEQHPLAAGPLIGLAELHRQQGKGELAEPLLFQALSILEQAMGPEHPQVSFPLSNLATLYTQQGKYEEAEVLYKRVLAIRQKALGYSHLQVMIPLANLAELYKRQGKYEQAEPLFLQAISILEQTLGPQHPQVAYPLQGLADLYREQGKYADSEALFLRAISILESKLEPHHPEVAETLEGLAGLYLKQGHYEKARSLLLRVYTIHEQTLGSEHATTRRVRELYKSVPLESRIK